jgi:hypothetical protein
MSRDYWVVLFTGTTWQEFLSAGGDTMGFRNTRWNYIQKIKPKDYLLCYLTGISRFIGVLEVQSEPYEDRKKRIWSDDMYPARIKVKPVAKLTPTTAVPVVSLRDKLSIFENLRTPSGWSVRFRASPQKWDDADGEIIVQAIKDAKKDPVKRPFNPRLFKRGRLGPYSEKYNPHEK